MTRIEYQNRMQKLFREKFLTGIVLVAAWLLLVGLLLIAPASDRLQGPSHHSLIVGVTVVGLIVAYGLWAIWVSRAVKKHDLLCPNCCRSLAGKTTSNRDAFRCPHCGIPIFPSA